MHDFFLDLISKRVLYKFVSYGMILKKCLNFFSKVFNFDSKCEVRTALNHTHTQTKKPLFCCGVFGYGCQQFYKILPPAGWNVFHENNIYHPLALLWICTSDPGEGGTQITKGASGWSRYSRKESPFSQ